MQKHDKTRATLHWLRKKDGIALVDTQGRELYEGVLTADAHLITEADAAGYFPVRKNGLYGYADAQTGKISIPPQFAAAAAFEKHNGTLRAVAARRAETYPFGQTDLMSAYYSENWLYIDPQGNTLPQRPNLPGGCIPQPYCQNSLPERFSGRLKP